MFIFCQAAHSELTWLNEREDKEAQRDWSDKNIKISEVEQYYEVSGVWCRTIVRVSAVESGLLLIENKYVLEQWQEFLT